MIGRRDRAACDSGSGEKRPPAIKRLADAQVVLAPETYPAYCGSYDWFSTIREFADRFEGLHLVGRNGMHKYNNHDHSTFTALTAVDNIAAGIPGKENIWSINTEAEYHEERSGSPDGRKHG